jgi:hypothetical protein
MAPLTPEQRRLRGRLGALVQQSRNDVRETTRAARDASPGSLSHWENQVDPDGILEPAERLRRADAAHRAHMTKLAFASATARAARRNAGDAA